MPVEGDQQQDQSSPQGQQYGPNNEKLPIELQKALQDILTQVRNENQRARRDELKRVRKAHDFWRELQYSYYSEADHQWHYPFENDTRGVSAGASSDDDSPRYMYTTNIYQAFGLSVMAILTQDLPTVKVWPQDPRDEGDLATAKAGSTVVDLVERNNRMPARQLETAFNLWCDGKCGAYVRYVCDGDRWGYSELNDLEPQTVKLGEDAYECPGCGAETPTAGFMGVCQSCGDPLDDSALRPADVVQVPNVQQTTKVPNGAEVITMVGGLGLTTPPYCSEIWEFPYLVWSQELHKSKLRAMRPDLASKIGSSNAGTDATSQLARQARLSQTSGGQFDPPWAAGDLTANMITFEQAWLKPWMFYMLEDKAPSQKGDGQDAEPSRCDQLLQLFPKGCYVAFAGMEYFGSRNESMTDHWRVCHALPGDGQQKPAMGQSMISVQERDNELMNITMETAEYGIPATYFLDDAIAAEAIPSGVVEPGAMYPCDLPPGVLTLDGCFSHTEPARVSPDVINHEAELRGPVGQFLTGAFPALFGGDTGQNDTLGGIAIQRDQAMGRVGLVWRNMKYFYADVMMLAIECFRNNRPDDVAVPIWGASAEFEAKWIRKADLKGNFVCYPESDEDFPTIWSQQRAAVMQLLQMAVADPYMLEVADANIGTILKLIGLEELEVPDEDVRTQQMREISLLLQGGPQESMSAGPMGQPMPQAHSTVAVDPILDNHAEHMKTIENWWASDAGQSAKIDNPQGVENVKQHYIEHQQAEQMKAKMQMMAAAQMAPPIPPGAAPGGPPAQGAPAA